MKHNNMQNETQVPKNIKDVCAENNWVNSTFKTNRMTRSMASTGDREKGAAIEPNIFLTQNKGKGPPGRPRGPAETKPNRFRKPVRFDQIRGFTLIHLVPEASPLWGRFGGGLLTNTEIDDYKKYKLNFIQLLNSITMKKQIFILILAVFASVTVAFGQATHFSPATTVTCPNDALNPIAGKTYSYSAAVTNTPGTAKWHVVAGTPSTQFINNGSWAATDETTTGSYILNSTPDPLSSIAVATSPSTVSITWESSGLSQIIADPTNKKLFVALEYNGTTNCNNNNLQVWEIHPKNAFTIDVFNTDGVGVLGATGATASTCYSSIAGATYNGGNVKMDYGTNTITYEIVAANFTGSFSSTVQVSGLQTGQTADVSWGYTIATAGANALTGSGGNGVYSTINAVVDPTTDTTNGVSVFVRVVVHNNGYEGLTNDGIILAADAKDSSGQDDVKTDCTPETAYTDQATHTLMQRPTINNPLPTPFLNKN